jgi:hypothetical protein
VTPTLDLVDFAGLFGPFVMLLGSVICFSSCLKSDVALEFGASGILLSALTHEIVELTP